MIKIEAVTAKSASETMDFLRRYADQAQFLLSNLANFGFRCGDHLNSSDYFILRDQNDCITTVFSHGNRKNILYQSTQAIDPNIILDFCKETQRVVGGFIGDWTGIEPLYHTYCKRNPDYQPSYVSKEILYDRNLIPEGEIRDESVRLLTKDDFQAWTPLQQGFLQDTGIQEIISEDERRRLFESMVKENCWWGLWSADELLAVASLNGKFETRGQLGGVYTKREHRSRGLSKRLIRHILADCIEIHGHTRNILFTGESNIPARKVYEGLGYGTIGHYAIILE
ncbi:MAG: GNAT family N-acetyltransferase [Pseudobacteriovorax sp.]|nr:GNAT family N-acetyltransferase [Pseudobacteriovorax sp.]